GDPLLKEGIEDLIRFAGSCRVEHVATEGGALVSRFGPPKLWLLTNGKALTERILDLCAEVGSHLSLSLPGISAFRGLTGGDPENVLRWFGRAKARDLRTTVGVTVTRTNLGELYETLAEALLAGAETILLNRFLQGGRGIAHAAELALDAEGIARMLDTAEEVLRAANRRGTVGTELPKCLVPDGRYERLEVGTRCSAAVDFFVVDPSGYVRVCNHSPVRLNHVSEIGKVKDHPYWRRFTRKDYLPSACHGCADRTRCDGGCREAAHIVGGAPDSPDPLLGKNA
ncbi:MAG: SPASM domain-containing protein, partial [Planctomycetes bacterium]|nr:SPASM domain-containing protein [Planctomycetota bacterium]